MNPYLVYIRIGLVALLLAGLGWGCWYINDQGYERGKAEIQNTIVAQQAESLTAYTNRLNNVENQYAKDHLAVTTLRTQLDSVQVHIPTCPGNSTPGNSDGGAGVLSSRVDEAFARLQKGVGDLTGRCDELNLEARKLNGLR